MYKPQPHTPMLSMSSRGFHHGRTIDKLSRMEMRSRHSRRRRPRRGGCAFAIAALACSCAAAGMEHAADDSSLLGSTAAEHGAQHQQLAAASVLDRHGRRHLAGSPHREVLPPQCDRKWGNNDARLVYLDLGVNWANTLRLYRDLGVCPPDDPRWEIYGFEASPLLHPYVDQMASEFFFLDRQTKKSPSRSRGGGGGGGRRSIAAAA